MFARVSVYDVPADRRDEAHEAFRQAIERISESAGMTDAYLFLGCDSERAITITLWESHAAMTASRVSASAARTEASRAVDAEIVSVEEYEVVAHDQAKPQGG